VITQQDFNQPKSGLVLPSQCLLSRNMDYNRN